MKLAKGAYNNDPHRDAVLGAGSACHEILRAVHGAGASIIPKLAVGAYNNNPAGMRVWVQAQPAVAIHGWIAIFNG